MTTRVELTPEQVPEQLRGLLVNYMEAQRRALDAKQAVQRVAIPERHKLAGRAEETAREAAAAHVALMEATREQPDAMRAFSAARFAASVGRAREFLQAAEAELRTAAGHARVSASVRPGRPCVNTERIERAEQAPGLQRAMGVVSLLREVIDSLPEDID
ncbi:hypothetical protein [Streptomyces antibioticus]|uniref:hypothetical protein n=1 Tax=Streptomyces antibioticus TaxID=1890 RepID=UPI0033AC9B16